MKQPPDAVDKIQQGHLYQHIFTGKMVIALGNGLTSDALILDMREPSGTAGKMLVQAAHLIPQPMKYFGGRVP